MLNYDTIENKERLLLADRPNRISFSGFIPQQDIFILPTQLSRTGKNMIGKKNIPSQIGLTAFWTASVRALEARYPQPLFVDPFAEALAGSIGSQWMAERSPESVIPIILRTRFFDDFLQKCVSVGSIRQVVLMAAGLDARAVRMVWSDEMWIFELDQPEILQYKESILLEAGGQPSCQSRLVAVDLNQDWFNRLRDAGFQSQLPAIWLLEGFLFYLPQASVVRILKDVSREAAPGSWLGFDIINHAMLTHPLTQKWIDMQAAAGAPWIGYLDDPEAFLWDLGWKAAITQAGQPDAHYGRWNLPVLPTKMDGVPHNWFVTAQKVSGEG